MEGCVSGTNRFDSVSTIGRGWTLGDTAEMRRSPTETLDSGWRRCILDNRAIIMPAHTSSHTRRRHTALLIKAASTQMPPQEDDGEIRERERGSLASPGLRPAPEPETLADASEQQTPLALFSPRFQLLLLLRVSDQCCPSDGRPPFVPVQRDKSRTPSRTRTLTHNNQLPPHTFIFRILRHILLSGSRSELGKSH